MKALTIKQPWAQLIALGLKDVENRTWKTNFRGRIYIHASMKPVPFNGMGNGVKFSTDQLRLIFKLPENRGERYPDAMSKYVNSAIIGEVDIVDCVTDSTSIWAQPGHWHWILANAVHYDKPVLKVKGALSFWEYNLDIGYSFEIKYSNRLINE
jgi:hypothetical protein